LMKSNNRNLSAPVIDRHRLRGCVISYDMLRFLYRSKSKQTEKKFDA
jgi:hypothetical protein